MRHKREKNKNGLGVKEREGYPSCILGRGKKKICIGKKRRRSRQFRQ